MRSNSNNSSNYMFCINDDIDLINFKLRVSRLMKYLDSEKIDNVEQFKEDIYCVIKRLSESHVSNEELTATEMMIKNREYYIQKEKEQQYKKHIEELKKESIYKTKVLQKIEEIRRKNLGKVGDIIIKILKELLEE